ncbi:MAG: DUF4258 domain-containing protein [Kiloniellales bacterium]
MDCDRILFSGHAIRRMFERGLRVSDVAAVLRHGEVIDVYPEDTPFPSRLMLGFVGSRAIHVVVAADPK